MTKFDKAMLVILFVCGCVGFWLITGYQANWDPEHLRRMIVIRVGFSLTFGLLADVGYCLYKLVTS